MLSSIPEHKAGMCHTKKIHVLDEVCAGVSCNAAGCEFGDNESAVYRPEIHRFYIENVTRGSQGPNPALAQERGSVFASAVSPVTYRTQLL